MEGVSLATILQVGSTFGTPGVVLLLWWWSDKERERTLDQYRDHMETMFKRYELDIQATKQMYIDNVVLVKAYEKIANGLQDLIVLNTQTITKVCDKIEGNQYCPMVRLKKEAKGVQD